MIRTDSIFIPGSNVTLAVINDTDADTRKVYFSDRRIGDLTVDYAGRTSGTTTRWTFTPSFFGIQLPRVTGYLTRRALLTELAGRRPDFFATTTAEATS